MDEIIDNIANMHEQYTEQWHHIEDQLTESLEGTQDTEKMLYNYVKANHLMNFKLWHTEDIARRKDVSPDVIAECKYKIDILNQKRTNYYEAIDAAITQILLPLLPKESEDIQNTETIGMTIDRLSILSLKIYHMNEQKLRTDTSIEKVKSAADKLNILLKQRHALIRAIKYLIQEYIRGKKRMEAYYQFKMYNAPETNPQIYQNTTKNS